MSAHNDPHTRALFDAFVPGRIDHRQLFARAAGFGNGFSTLAGLFAPTSLTPDASAQDPSETNIAVNQDRTSSIHT